MRPRRPLFQRLATPPLVLLAALFIFIEDWVWDAVARQMARLARLPPVARLEAAIGRLGPYPAMCLFLVPVLVDEPVKLVGLWLIATGQPLLGLALLVGVKLVATAVAVRLWVLCRPQMMTVAWFARAVNWTLGVKARVHALVRGLAVWRLARRTISRIRRHGFLARRFKAARRRLGSVR